MANKGYKVENGNVQHG